MKKKQLFDFEAYLLRNKCELHRSGKYTDPDLLDDLINWFLSRVPKTRLKPLELARLVDMTASMFQTTKEACASIAQIEGLEAEAVIKAHERAVNSGAVPNRDRLTERRREMRETARTMLLILELTGKTPDDVLRMPRHRRQEWLVTTEALLKDTQSYRAATKSWARSPNGQNR